MEAPHAPLPTVELHVPDFSPVRDFYGRLEFLVSRDEPGCGKDGYLVMSLERNVIAFWCGNEAVFEHSYFSQFPRAAPRGVGVELVLQVSRLEEYFDRVRSKISITDGLRARPWGLSDFRCVDPYGYYLRITSMHEPKRVADGGGRSSISRSISD